MLLLLLLGSLEAVIGQEEHYCRCLWRHVLILVVILKEFYCKEKIISKILILIFVFFFFCCFTPVHQCTIQYLISYSQFTYNWILDCIISSFQHTQITKQHCFIHFRSGMWWMIVLHRIQNTVQYTPEDFKVHIPVSFWLLLLLLLGRCGGRWALSWTHSPPAIERLSIRIDTQDGTVSEVFVDVIVL